MSIAVQIFIANRNRLAPVSTAFKVNVFNVCASINDIGVDTLAGILRVEVFVECSEGEAITVGDTSETPWSVLLEFRILFLESVDLRVKLDIFDL